MPAKGGLFDALALLDAGWRSAVANPERPENV
jgi:hypothetical protein